MPLARGDSGDAGEHRWCRGETIVRLAPGDDGAVALERQAVMCAGRDSDDVVEPGGHRDRLWVLRPAPGDDGAIALQCQAVVSAGGDGNDVGEPSRYGRQVV